MVRSDRIVYHNNGGQDDGSTNVDEYSTYPNSLTGLQLAKYVLMRLVDNHSVEKIASLTLNYLVSLNMSIRR